MPSRMATLRDAVAETLRNGPFSFPFDVFTENVNQVNLEASNRTRIFVNPGTKTYTADTRVNFLQSYNILIHVTNFVDTNSLQEEDNALQLVEEIEDFMANREVAGYPFTSFSTDNNPEPMFVAEEISQYNFFHSLISVFYLG